MTNSPDNRNGSFAQNGAGGTRYRGQHTKKRESSTSDADEHYDFTDPKLEDLLEPSAADKPVVIRKRKRRKRKMSTGNKIALIAVIAVVCAGAVAAIAFGISVGQIGNKLKNQENLDVTAPDSSNAVVTSQGRTVSYNGHTYQLNENMVSVVFMGVDKTSTDIEGGVNGQADAVMVVAMDTSTGKVSVISIPRDTMCEVNTQGSTGASTGLQTMQLCLAYNYGGDSAASAQNVSQAVSRILYNVPMNYYFMLDEEGVGAMANSIGGVALTALYDIPSAGITAGDDVILSGDDALVYVQYRDTSVLDSTLQRVERQKQFVSAFAAQTLARAKGNVGMLTDLYNTVLEYSVTDLGASDFSYLALSVVNNGITDVSMTSLSGELTQPNVYAEYNLDETATYETVLSVYYTQTD